MSEQKIKCPNCDFEIPLTDTLVKQTEKALRTKIANENASKEADLERQSKFLNKRAKNLEEEKSKINEEVQYQLKAQTEKIADQERTKILAEQSNKTEALEQELSEQRAKISAANKLELELRKQQRDLEDEKNNLELKVQRTIDQERKSILAKAKEEAAEEQFLKMEEKNEILASMKRTIDDLKRKAELGSQEAQGEALEKNLQESLQQAFTYDKFSEVKKGIRGADIIQTVYNSAGKICGTIIWELKHTKLFAQSWIDKLKKDQQASNSDIAVLMTVTLPKEIENFGIYQNVWVTDYKSTLGLATALRGGLIEVTKQKAISSGNASTKQLIYEYVTGREFSMHIQVIVSAFARMQEELETEKRAISRIWKKREKQISNVLNNISGMRGSIEGISQKALPKVSMMSLEEIGDEDE